MAPLRGKDLVESLHGFGRELGEFAVARHQRVGSEYARSAGVGENTKPLAPGTRLLGQYIRHKEDVSDAVDAKNAGAAEGRVQYFIAAGERAGVRGGGLGSGGGPSRLDDDDRLGQRDFARRREEGARVANRFHVDDDALGARVTAEVIDQVAP